MPNRDPFLSALPDSRRARLAAIPELDALLARHLASAHAAWPALDLADEIFLGHLAMRLPESAGEAELAALHASDLYLACACAGGSEPAIRLFEAAYFAEVDRAARQVGADLSLAVEAKQILRRRLFVADGDKPAAAALFAGRGDLRGWLRVAATRELVALVGRQRRDLALDDERLLDLFAAADDPALAYLREHYRDPCNQAFRAALAALPARQRSLLRYQLDGLSIDAIAALHAVHRATAARWLAAARSDLLDRVRAEVAVRLQITPAEVDSVLRLVKSRLEIGFDTALRA